MIGRWVPVWAPEIGHVARLVYRGARKVMLGLTRGVGIYIVFCFEREPKMEIIPE